MATEAVLYKTMKLLNYFVVIIILCLLSTSCGVNKLTSETQSSISNESISGKNTQDNEMKRVKKTVRIVLLYLGGDFSDPENNKAPDTYLFDLTQNGELIVSTEEVVDSNKTSSDSPEGLDMYENMGDVGEPSPFHFNQTKSIVLSDEQLIEINNLLEKTNRESANAAGSMQYWHVFSTIGGEVFDEFEYGLTISGELDDLMTKFIEYSPIKVVDSEGNTVKPR